MLVAVGLIMATFGGLFIWAAVRNRSAFEQVRRALGAS